jgi:hypothetical protein
MRIVDSEDEELPDLVSLLQKAKALSKTASRTDATLIGFGRGMRLNENDNDDLPHPTTLIAKTRQKKTTPKPPLLRRPSH